MYYNDFGTWIRKQFPDFRVQKISIDAGFSCPNRDGENIEWGMYVLRQPHLQSQLLRPEKVDY